MIPTLKSYKKLNPKSAVCILDEPLPADIPDGLRPALKRSLHPKAEGETSINLFHDGQWHILAVPPPKASEDRAEQYRLAGARAYAELKKYKLRKVQIHTGNGDDALAFAEGLASRNYRFESYKSKKDSFSLDEISLPEKTVGKDGLTQLSGLLEAVMYARDLVNEPANILTAVELSKRITEASKKGHYKVEVFGKAKIKSLKMGGILSVNQGSKADPTFTVIEYKSKKALNDKPIVLVGKGVVYDSGGLSLKPTANSMDIMKSDMGGAAAVAGAIHAAALNGLPIHVIGLIPATDNCIGPEAYGPGDVITLYDGTRVEVMNTDAEGRLVLADALSYAKKYDPKIVIDLATLTGASMRALGYFAAATMGTADENTQQDLMDAANTSGERLVSFPLWGVYDDELKSDIADMRNIGKSSLAGAIVAGKFLQHFTDYPWMHIDIAGPSFIPDALGYLPKGATGFGTKLIYQFLKGQNQ